MNRFSHLSCEPQQLTQISFGLLSWPVQLRLVTMFWCCAIIFTFSDDGLNLCSAWDIILTSSTFSLTHLMCPLLLIRLFANRGETAQSWTSEAYCVILFNGIRVVEITFYLKNYFYYWKIMYLFPFNLHLFMTVDPYLCILLTIVNIRHLIMPHVSVYVTHDLVVYPSNKLLLSDFFSAQDRVLLVKLSKWLMNYRWTVTQINLSEVLGYYGNHLKLESITLKLKARRRSACSVTTNRMQTAGRPKSLWQAQSC